MLTPARISRDMARRLFEKTSQGLIEIDTAAMRRTFLNPTPRPGQSTCRDMPIDIIRATKNQNPCVHPQAEKTRDISCGKKIALQPLWERRWAMRLV